jgi:hypothetical protein
MKILITEGQYKKIFLLEQMGDKGYTQPIGHSGNPPSRSSSSTTSTSSDHGAIEAAKMDKSIKNYEKAEKESGPPQYTYTPDMLKMMGNHHWYNKLSGAEKEYVFDKYTDLSMELGLHHNDAVTLYKMKEELIDNYGSGGSLRSKFENLYKKGEGTEKEEYETSPDEDGDTFKYDMGDGKFLATDPIFILDVALSKTIGEKAALQDFTPPKGGIPTFPGPFKYMDVLTWKKMPTVRALGLDKAFEETSMFLTKYKHQIIDILALASLMIPVIGPFISVGLEGLNAVYYFQEGDYVNGGISLGLMLIPGGFVARGALKQAKVLKYADEVTEIMVKTQKETGKKATKEFIEKELKEKMGEKMYKSNKNLLDNYFNNVLPKIGSKSTAQGAKQINNVIKVSQSRWKSFVSKPQVFEKYMKMNGGDIYKAYLSYLFKTGTKEALIGLGLYTIIINTPGLITDYKEWSLRTDAEKGNIASIVRQEGYEWELTKQIFGSDGTGDQNTLLKKAWKEGWRPYDKNKSPVALEDADLVPLEYQTDSYKERIAYMASAEESLERLNNSAIFNAEEFTTGPLTEDPSTFNGTIDWSL